MPDFSSASTTNVELTEASAGNPVNVRIGHRLQLTLAETRTTGYQWKLDHACPAILALESDHASAPSEARPGGPGTHAWVFRAQAAGSCELRVLSARSWGANETGKVLSFPVHVLP